MLNSSGRKCRDRKSKGVRTGTRCRPIQNPVDQCERRAQIWPGRPPDRLWQRNGRPERLTNWKAQLSVGPGRPGWSTEEKGWSIGRSTDAFCSPYRIQTPFLFWGRIQSGFPKSLGLSGYKYGLELLWIVSHWKSLLKIPWSKEQVVIDYWINKISLSLAPRT